ncbi:MAG TPA: (d)CMP kinase [Desulfobacteraceae bacterium]|nr:(d)CMP kinase [Desulfobacteraceae bacterium]
MKTITIDGPAGSGKTTVSRLLAEKLGYLYVDTGSLYRGVALEVDENSIDWKNDYLLDAFLRTLDFQFVVSKGVPVLLSSGRDISRGLRSSRISMLASAVSAKPAVRTFLLGMQKEIAGEHNAVFEGRDMGTVVFPRADVKFFLSADLKTRALRRYNEMDKNRNRLEDVEKSMALRDENDSQRRTSPMMPARDAVMIDSTGLTARGVVEKMYAVVINT